MDLTQALADLATQSAANLPAAARATMAAAAEDLANSALTDTSLTEGDTAPDFTLPDATGQPVSLYRRLQAGPVVISFYRGGWCPYCNLELRALQQALPDIQACGASLMAISPQTPDNSLSTAEKQALEFAVLSDGGNQVARQFGLVFTLPDALRAVYQSFGIDLTASNGDASFELPIAATYVIGTDGTIVHAFVDTDYRQRQDPAEIVQVLRRLTVTA